MLSCSCPCDDGEAPWYYYRPEDFEPLKATRAKRCKSCGRLIKIGEPCLEFPRTREPRNAVEEKIYGEGDTISLASWYFCEDCGEKYLNLTAAGYCFDPTCNMVEAMDEYHKLTGFKPERQ